MIFVPPIGRQPANKEAVAEETGFKTGELLEAKVVRRVGDRYLFVDIGKQLRVKIHWELPFEVKPGEILNFEVVSEDPPTFKLVEPRSPKSSVAETAPREIPSHERVDISTKGERAPIPRRVTYGPALKAKVVSQHPEMVEEKAAPALLPSEEVETVHAQTTPAEVSEEEPVFFPRRVSQHTLPTPETLTNLVEVLSKAAQTGISESVFTLLSEEPFFSLYEETPAQETFSSDEVNLLKNLLVKGLGKEELGATLRGMFKIGDSKVEGLLRLIRSLADLSLQKPTPPEADDAGSPSQESGSSASKGLKGTFSDGAVMVSGETPPAESIPQRTEEGLQEPLPTLSTEQSTKVESDESSVRTGFQPVAEAEEGSVPLMKGGESLAIRIWPAASRFTIDSTTPTPPGLELDVGDMLQGKVVEVEGNKVIIDFGSFETQATWEAAHTVKPGATIKVMVASLLPQLRLRLVDEASFKAFTAKLGSMKGWGQLFSKLQGAIENLPLVKADKGEGVLLRTLKGFMANNGLSTEARMARVVEGELPPEELKNDLKLQLAHLIASGGRGEQIEAAKELMQSINGHQLLNVQTQDSGFFIIPLVVAYHQRIDEWRMTVSEEEAEGERWFRLTLLSSPPEIGTIRIDLSYAQKAKRLDMLFWVERDESKRLLEEALPLLKEEFVESQVNLTRVEVGVSKQLSKEDLPLEVRRPFLLQMRA